MITFFSFVCSCFFSDTDINSSDILYRYCH